MNSILHPSDQVFDIALQSGTKGNVFASVCNGIIRLFDIRQSVTDIWLYKLHYSDYIIPLKIYQLSLQNQLYFHLQGQCFKQCVNPARSSLISTRTHSRNLFITNNFHVP